MTDTELLEAYLKTADETRESLLAHIQERNESKFSGKASAEF